MSENALRPEGSEYALAGLLPGDQVFAHLAISTTGGYVVWHDNYIDGDGNGIAARRLDQTLTGTMGVFRINADKTGEQEFPQVALFADGGAIVVWQGGGVGFPRIYARFLQADGTFQDTAGADLRVSTAETIQEAPQVATLTDGTAVVVWTSLNQDGSLGGVFGQRLSRAGAKIGDEFQVNQRVALNQRSPVLAALPSGKFVVVWVSEKETPLQSAPGEGFYATTAAQPYDVSVYARSFDAGGPLSDEFKINTTAYTCANPAVAAGPDGNFLVVWSARVGKVTTDTGSAVRSWDVAARGFGADGTPAGDESFLNVVQSGDQFRPSVTAVGQDFLAVWISLGQDGSREGIVGRSVTRAGQAMEDEFVVNATTAGPQKIPAVASDSAGKALVIWSSTAGGIASFDMFGQRYSNTLQLRTPAKPLVHALSASRLMVSWVDLAELGAVSYELYVDSAATPVPVTANYHVVPQLAANSEHSFRLAYVASGGRRSPLSATASGRTWGSDENFDGLPDDWQATYWGPDSSTWPSSTADGDHDGAKNLQEFLAGTDPTDASSVLRLSWEHTDSGAHLNWNTVKGNIYQVQVSHDLTQWQALDTPRFAAGTSDFIQADPENAGSANGKALYRVIRIR